jgi:hypothetical protein
MTRAERAIDQYKENFRRFSEELQAKVLSAIKRRYGGAEKEREK